MISISHAPQIVAGVNLDELVDALLRADSDILEIVLFGSGAYAPELAGDIDLIVLTRHKKEIDVYWDATADLDLPLDVDVIPREIGDRWGEDIALSVMAVGISLYGDNLVFEEAQKFMSVPTYDDARFMFHVGAEILDLARSQEKESHRDQAYKVAFDTLFEAARLATMTFLASDNARWGQLAKELPKPFELRFREIISVCHIQYHYQGTYPKDQPVEEYEKWRVTVNHFIDDLDKETQAQNAKPDQEENGKE